MPVMDGSDPHDLARGLRPQEFGKTRPTSIDDPLVEPAWPGLRVIAAVADGRATLWLDGEPLEELAPLGPALRAATSAVAGDGAIVDGYLTKTRATEGIGIQVGVYEYPSITSQMTKFFIGGRRNRAEDMQKRREEEAADAQFDETDKVSLIVNDLLWLDGQWLLDVPLLERKRVLESILPPGHFVRPGPYVRMPIDSWLGSWRAQGFRGMAFKAANSRYRPGETAEDWTLADMPRR
jgi:ATP dependent DNA ligase domain